MHNKDLDSQISNSCALDSEEAHKKQKILESKVSQSTLLDSENRAKALLDAKKPSQMSLDELEILCAGIRARILNVVSKNGGHLSSTLGAVELIVAMHHAFDCQKDPFIFDVSHQAYAHKLLTGRWDEFASLRTFGGLSGFCKPSESDSDFFLAGHSSTSISLAVGAAKTFALESQNSQNPRTPIVLIGDGAMSSGLVYEALNELGALKKPVLIILNDNEMSISKPIGAISNYLSQALSSQPYQSMRARFKKMLDLMPESASYIAKRFEESFKLITPGLLFEELGIEYFGPIDGHNLKLISNTLKRAYALKKPVLIHAQTTKGKGYEIAEGRFEKWHGVSPFDIQTGLTSGAKVADSEINSQNIQPAKPQAPNPTKIFSQALLELAKIDSKIIGVTAAMPSGTGLDALIEFDKTRFFDVAIAEAHAVTSMSAAAKCGYKPFVAIYSTFLQRAFDSIIHDTSIMSLPVRFCIDRAGIVGEDGETHQGLLDIAYLRCIPNMVLFAPRDNETLKKAVKFAADFDSSPCAFRYPRGKFILDSEIFEASEFELGKAQILKFSESNGEKIVLIGYGNGVGRAYECYQALKEQGISATLLDLRFVKPLDEQTLSEIFVTHKRAFVFSDSYLMGGVGSVILEFISESGISGVQLKSFEIKDQFIAHGSSALVEKSLKLDSENLTKQILKML